MKKEIPKAYDAREVEDKVYKIWEDSGFFNPDNLPCAGEGKTPDKFVISMPPPNATGILHLGHASMLAYQDLMVRFNRLKQKQTLWLPGTDHASIATQTKVEKIIAEEGKTKYDLGREKFLERVHEYVEGSQDTIRNQVRKMGSSCDWSRERYTLDEGLSEVVKEVFEMMYKDGLIYRGDRIVNWCPRCESTLADDEVEHQETKGKFYFFRYSKDFPITIATTRPETKLGDVAVAVNPKDEKYKEFVGKIYKINLGNGEHEIKIIADRNVDMTFGTGALGVTPAHSMVDFQMAHENDLPVIKVIGEDGRMTAEAGEDYEGLTTVEAREKIAQYFRDNGLMEKEEEVDQNLSICYRCDATIEPLPSLQWFIDVNKKITKEGNKYFQDKSLKEVMLQVVREREVKIIPERFEKAYFSWVENLRDWCISRQLWFGHRVPVWYCEDCGEIILNKKDEEACPKCKSENIKQDSDTFDTWFSSGMWTFSTLMDKDFTKYNTFEEWMKSSPDLAKFHPTSVMETGYDILPLWVARMILMTTYVVGEIPFENVYLHGMLRDKEGRKMSKSLGNGIDPLEMIEKYGTDALRLSLIVGSAPGNDLKVYEEKIENYRNFVNKLWNISRYILMSVKEVGQIEKRPEAKTLADEWILGEIDILVASVGNNLENFRFSLAGEDIYDFAWSKLADWYLEIAKVEGDKDEILLYALERLLIVLHPFAPFVTEEIWKNFGFDNLIMIEKWPESSVSVKMNIDEYRTVRIVGCSEEDAAIRGDFELIKNMITSIRNIRAEYKIEPVKKLKAVIVSIDKKDLIESQAEIIKFLGRIEELEMVDKFEKSDDMAMAVLPGVEIFVSLEGLVDREKERQNLLKEKENLEKFVKNLEAKLENETFVAKAPAKIIEQEKTKLTDSKDRLGKVEEKIKSLL
ncbi:MAG: valine--tRNA ligase [Candidatus Pacebacteria bacterium]|nr:valine--tRNA ligase [Candidatus Paceibacterota bacterium]